MGLITRHNTSLLIVSKFQELVTFEPRGFESLPLRHHLSGVMGLSLLGSVGADISTVLTKSFMILCSPLDP